MKTISRIGAALAILTLPFSLQTSCPGQEEPADELTKADQSVTEDDRQHWAFLPLKRSPVPETKNPAWVRNEIDAFILARLEKNSMVPADPAPGHSLLRRMTLDLVGLPPTLEQQATVLAKPTPEAFDSLVDTLLQDEGYGERWGRHWLDLVRYAETNGYERDAGKPSVWRYRDYVIRSFNSDKPYDRFILEQLAGDELDDVTAETMIATGFYRLGPWDDEPADFPQDRFDQLDDMLNATSQTFLGITLACARCHDHKFEAFTQHDYYKMIAVFDPLRRPQNGRTDLDAVAGSRAEIAQRKRIQAAVGEQEERIHSAYQPFGKEFLEAIKDGKIESALPEDVRSLLVKPWNELKDSERAKVRARMPQAVKEISPLLPEEAARLCTGGLKELTRLRAGIPNLPRGYFYLESSPQPPTTHLLVRGSASSPGPVVQPGVPTVLARQQPEFMPPDDFTTRRRLTMARWIASPDNPLTPRVIVNRIWQRHLGVGIVRTPSDFGVMGAAPTHEALLDWLSHWFVHDANWSLKKLHRLIMTSNTYRMSAVGQDAYYDRDPENELLWRKPYVRLEVEAIRDSMLAISGKLDRTMYGPSMYPFVPGEVLDGHADKQRIWPAFDEERANRRTVYAYVKRSMIVPFLEVLDLCDTTKPAPERLVTSVAPQALTMFNGNFVNRQARYLAERLVREAGEKPADQIDLAFRLALARKPTRQESKVLLEFLNGETVAAERKKDTSSDSAQTRDGLPAEGLVLKLDATAGVKADDKGRVTSWSDSSGGNLVARAEGQPQLVKDGLQGKATIRMNGQSDWFSIPQPVMRSQQFTIFAVATDLATSGHRNLIGNWDGSQGNSVSSIFLGTTGSGAKRIVRLTDHLNTESPARPLDQPTRPFLLMGIAGTSRAAIGHNGRVLGTLKSALPMRKVEHNWTVGRQGTLDSEYWHGDIAEILVYQRELTHSEILRVHQYIRKKYSLPIQDEAEGMPAIASARQRALIQVCRVLLNLNELAYAD